MPLLAACVDPVGQALASLTPAQLAQPSGLPGWSVRDLAAHLVVIADSVRHLEPLPANAGVLSISEYVAGYLGRAERISGLTLEAAAEMDDIPAGYQERWDDALAHLESLGDVDKVLARRGAARLADLVVTRIIELVVHADDLARAVSLPVPVGLPRQPPRWWHGRCWTCWPSVTRGVRSRCACRPWRRSSAWPGRGTREAPRPVSWRPTRSPGRGWLPVGSAGPRRLSRAH